MTGRAFAKRLFDSLEAELDELNAASSIIENQMDFANLNGLHWDTITWSDEMKTLWRLQYTEKVNCKDPFGKVVTNG